MVNIERIANVCQIVEAISIGLTLVFIALQLRATKRIAAASSYHNLFQSVNQFYSSLFANEGLALLYVTGRKDPDKLTSEERFRFLYACVQVFCFYEDLFLQHSQGLLPTEHFDSWCDALKDDLRDPGFVRYWRQERNTFTSDFRSYIDDIMRSHGVADLINGPILEDG